MMRGALARVKQPLSVATPACYMMRDGHGTAAPRALPARDLRAAARRLRRIARARRPNPALRRLARGVRERAQARPRAEERFARGALRRDPARRRPARRARLDAPRDQPAA